MNLNLANQQLLYNQVAPKVQDLKTSMDLRIPMWNKIDNKDKLKWVEWDKDPIMKLSANIAEYFCKNFSDMVQYYLDKHDDTP